MSILSFALDYFLRLFAANDYPVSPGKELDAQLEQLGKHID